MSTPMLPPAPPEAPKLNSKFWPWLARCLLRLSGWKLLGELPNEPKLIIIGAPHSSYWDGYYGLLMKIGLGVDINIMIKREVLDGPLVRAAAIEGGVLLSVRGGDYELTVGQDLSIGYAAHDRQTVELYLTESFTFRVLETVAAVRLSR